MASHLSNPTIACVAQGSLRPGRYAAIDIGTVTCRMLVADLDAQGVLHELRREYAITNLGEDVDATGVLKLQAMQRVADAVSGYLDILEGCAPADGQPIMVKAVATSASRDAKNASEFAALMREVGITLAVVPGEREAALSFLGASCDFVGENLLVVDIGGGSTELVAGQAGSEPLQTHSFNIGCRRATERFLAADPLDANKLNEARAWIREEMGTYFGQLKERGFALDRVVAVAGTATSVVSVHERMAEYDSSRVHQYVVSRAVLDEVYDQLSRMPLGERERVVGLDPGRAPVIVAGLIVLQVVLDLAGASSFTVSESDILQGIILDAARVNA